MLLLDELMGFHSPKNSDKRSGVAVTREGLHWKENWGMESTMWSPCPLRIKVFLLGYTAPAHATHTITTLSYSSFLARSPNPSKPHFLRFRWPARSLGQSKCSLNNITVLLVLSPLEEPETLILPWWDSLFNVQQWKQVVNVHTQVCLTTWCSCGERRSETTAGKDSLQQYKLRLFPPQEEAAAVIKCLFIQGSRKLNPHWSLCDRLWEKAVVAAASALTGHNSPSLSLWVINGAVNLSVNTW